MPYLQYGPNNQYLQLMEAAAVAKALGRSLAAPSFAAWVNDESGSRGDTIAFADTFDIESVERYVPVAPLSEVGGNGVASGPLLAISDYKQKRMATFLQSQQLHCCPRKIKAQKPQSMRTTRDVLQLVQKHGLAEVPVLGWYSFFAVDKALLLEAARAFRRAPHIREKARAIAASLFGQEPFLAVHLRREASDLGCSFGRPSVLCSKPGPEFSVETAQVKKQIERLQQRAGVQHVYIATIAPAQHLRWKGELRELLATVGGAKSLSESERMAQTLGMPPQKLTRYLQSLIEQELCATAHAFLGSAQSTWTGNVELQRAANGLQSAFFGSV
uniref:GDP-fucose protein O-fucosyltransferase 2 n=1 Tax=Coccolithus braarudii TaxID=221442 RepID=A0A7S0LV98_9EUKA